MDANTVSSLVSTLGFPIVICLVFIVGFKYMFDKFMDRNAQITQEHKAEMDAMTTALNNNTVVLQKLCDKLDSDEEVNV